MTGLTAADVYYVARRLRAWVEDAVTQDLDHGTPLYVWVVVRDVVESPGSTVHDIQRRLGMPQSMVSKAVMRAAEQGWVERNTDPEDRRRVRVYPASAVQTRLQGRLNRSWDDLLGALFGGTLTGEDRAALGRALALLYRRLKALESGAAP
jgi:DNA-binding MarR family transcriptional regulator